MGKTDDRSFEIARARMVQVQLRGRDITDEAVLAVMEKVPRHEFVRLKDRPLAYSDQPLSIDHGQTISQPYVVASMTQEVRLNRSLKVLEIGTGCGYQTAVLAELAGTVFSIECIADLHRQAAERLKNLGYGNVATRVGDGSQGWPEEAPFDGIVVTAAAESVPIALIEQLADPGSLIIPLGPEHGSQELVLFTKTGGRTERRSLYSVRFVPLRSDHPN
jgi:protein-L-isoaspartate(D-aspartate) O-methyltransferase